MKFLSVEIGANASAITWFVAIAGAMLALKAIAYCVQRSRGVDITLAFRQVPPEAAWMVGAPAI